MFVCWIFFWFVCSYVCMHGCMLVGHRLAVDETRRVFRRPWSFMCPDASRPACSFLATWLVIRSFSTVSKVLPNKADLDEPRLAAIPLRAPLRARGPVCYFEGRCVISRVNVLFREPVCYFEGRRVIQGPVYYFENRLAAVSLRAPLRARRPLLVCYLGFVLSSGCW